MNFIRPGRSHINLDQVVAFHWDDGYLVLYTTCTQPIIKIQDEDKKAYRTICDKIGMNMYRAEQEEVDG